MIHDEAEKYLQEHGIKPTAVRILVWSRVAATRSTFTLKNVEDWLPEMDKSSIFRTLRLFSEQHLLHETNDGSGQCKYCLCRCANEQHRGHVHFTCVKCGRTYCFDSTTIPEVPIPEGFQMEEAEYVIKGVCDQCRQGR